MKKTCPFNLATARPRILWEITSKCNLKCRHCLYYESEEAIGKDLTFEEICRIVDKIAADGRIKEVWLSGGEPLIRPDILEIITYISEKGLIPSLSTNGTLVTAENAPALFKGGIRYTHVSLDGIDAATHDWLRQTDGAFEKAVAGLRELSKNGILTGASFMVTEKSIDQVEGMLGLAEKLGLSIISFYMVEPLGRAAGSEFGDKRMLSQKLLAIKHRVDEKAIAFHGKAEFPRIFEEDMDIDILEECHAEKFFTLTSDGKLGVCPWLMKSKGAYIGGDLRIDDFAKSVENCEQYIVSMKQNRKTQGKCGQCGQNQVCGQGCPAVSRYSSADPYGRDRACER